MSCVGGWVGWVYCCIVWRWYCSCYTQLFSYSEHVPAPSFVIQLLSFNGTCVRACTLPLSSTSIRLFNYINFCILLILHWNSAHENWINWKIHLSWFHNCTMWTWAKHRERETENGDLCPSLFCCCRLDLAVAQIKRNCVQKIDNKKNEFSVDRIAENMPSVDCICPWEKAERKSEFQWYYVFHKSAPSLHLAWFLVSCFTFAWKYCHQLSVALSLSLYLWS